MLLAVATIGQNFTGSTYTVDSTSYPPDTDGAVGPNHFVEMINGRYTVYQKSNGARVQTSSLDNYWSTIVGVAAPGATFDPRVVYDHASGRWFAASVNNSQSPNDFLIAVSNSSDPTVGWKGFKIDSDATNTRWADFPTLGLDADGVYLAGNMFGLGATPPPMDITLISIPKADLLLATPTVANRTEFPNAGLASRGSTQHGAVDYGASDGRAAVLSAFDNTSRSRTSIVNAAGPGPATLSATTTISAAITIQQLDATQPDGTRNLEASDNRFATTVMEVGNSLWVAHGVDVGGRAGIRWYEISETTNAVLQTGTIGDASFDYFFPSIAANSFGEVLIGFSRSGIAAGTGFASAYAVAGITSGGVTTFSSPLLLKQGVANYSNLDSMGRNRWGDYSATTLDPSDPHTFWTIQEYVSATNVWSTQITQLTFKSPPVIQLSGGYVAYRENFQPVVIDAGAGVGDPDSPDFDTGNLTVTIVANGTVDDRLAIRNEGTAAGQIGVVGNIVTYGGQGIGTIGGGSGTPPLVVSLNANATVQAVQALVRNVTFFNVSDNPSPADRTIEFTVNDGDGRTSAPASMLISFVSINDGPALATIGNKTTPELVPFSFTISATDPDTPATGLNYSATGLPNGASFDPATRTFSWTPDEAQGPADYNITFRVTDGSFTASETILVTVTEVNSAPVFATTAGQTVNETNLLTFTVSATDPDLPAGTITYVASGLPAGAAFDPLTRTFNWVPTEVQGPASYVATFTASDGTLSTSQFVTINVSEVNQPPVLASLADRSVDEGQTIAFSLNVTDADLPLQPRLFSATGMPAGATLNPVTGDFNWTPSEAQGPGTFQITFKVSDGGASASQTMRISVGETNLPPVLGTIGNRQVNEGSLLTFTVQATDPDLPRNTLAFSATGLPAGAGLNASTGAFSWTPGETQGQRAYPVTFTVSDGNLSRSQEMTITVNDTLQPDLRGAAFRVASGDLWAGRAVNVDFQVQNTGTAAAGPFRVDLYLVSKTATNTPARIVGTQQFAGLASNSTTATQTLSVNLPAARDPFWKGDGDYYLGMIVDAGSQVVELNEGNNSTQGISLDTATALVQGTQGETVASGTSLSTKFYRAYNPTADYHFFTTSAGEFANAVLNGYRDETAGQTGIAVLSIPAAGASGIHRLYNPNTGRHYYTLSDGERDFLVTRGWHFEKDDGFMYTNSVAGSTEIFRLYNRNSGVHLYTENAVARDAILSQFPGIWVQHASLGFAFAAGPNSISTQAAVARAVMSAGAADSSSSSVVAVSAATSGAASDAPAVSSPAGLMQIGSGLNTGLVAETSSSAGATERTMRTSAIGAGTDGDRADVSEANFSGMLPALDGIFARFSDVNEGENENL